ncbi:MAG TPA: tetratricopeptide repeat protein [Polyangia bacterium]|jgi:tetratricopeptide (TPR) repeat protein
MASSISDFARWRRRFVAGAAILVALIVGATSAARAQPAAAGDANREAARAKLVAGVDAMKRGDYQAALARFQEAYALVPSPKIHYDFGLAYVGLERPADALAAFERFLAEAPDAPPDKREKAASLIPGLRARVAETGGRDEREAARAAPPAAQPPVAAAAQPVGVAPPPPVASPAARDERAVAAATDGGDPARRRRIAAVSLGAAGAGLLAAGVVFGVLARRESDGLTHDSEAGTPPAQPTPFDTGKESRGIAYERLQIVGLVAGGVAVAAGVALYATSRPRVTVEPGAGHALAGASLRVVF